MGTAILYMSIKLPSVEGDHSIPTTAEVNNEEIYTTNKLLRLLTCAQTTFPVTFYYLLAKYDYEGEQISRPTRWTKWITLCLNCPMFCTPWLVGTSNTVLQIIDCLAL
jgi:hypothetical protein